MPSPKPGLVVSLLCLLAVSCSVHELEIKDLESSGDDVFYASLESYSEPDTKVYVDENVKILWDGDDRISIFNQSTRNQQYAFLGKTGDNAGEFDAVSDPEGPAEPLPLICAVYPYQNSTRINKEGVMSLTLPAEQTYREGSFGPGANTMVSSTENHTLEFKNVGGYLVLKLYGEGVSVSSVTIEGNNGELLSGKANLTPAVGNLPTVTMERTAGTSITLRCENPVELKATKEEPTLFWMVVPPTNFSKGIKLTVTDSEGNQFVRETPVSLSIERNKVLRISPLRVVMVPIEYSKTSKLSAGSSYLIVDASDKRLFLGLTDGSYLDIAPEGGVITDTDGSLEDCEFTVENDGNNYYLKSYDGKYLICDYTNNGPAGLAYVDAPKDVKYPYALTTGNNGAFFFSTTQVNSSSNTDQVLYYKEPGTTNSDRFKIGGSGRSIGVHLYQKGGKLDRGLSFEPSSVICYLGEAPEKPVLSGIYSTVTYTSSDESIARVDANGTVTPVQNGTVTITATAEEDEKYSAGSAAYTLRIKKLKTTEQYVKVTSIDQVNTEGEYVIVYDDGSAPKIFKPILNSGKSAFSTSSDNARDVVIDDDQIEATDVDDCRILLANKEDRKFSLVVPEADGEVDYYFIVNRSSSIFLASTTEKGYRSTFEISPESALTLTGNDTYRFLYSSGAFSAIKNGSSSNLYLYVRTGGPAKQKQSLSFQEESVSWLVGEGYEFNESYDPQPVDGAQTTVTYMAEPESVVRIEDGKIKIIGTGTATITATAAKSDKFYSASASYSLRILKVATGGFVDIGTFNLENRALSDYLTDASRSYTDTDDATNTVMPTYVSNAYSDVSRKDCPAPVTVTWTNSASRSTVIAIYEDEDLSRQVCSQNATENSTSAYVYNLIPGRTYYYTVSEGGTVWEKGCFNTTGRRRMIKVSDTWGRGHANNFRDLGGLEVTYEGTKKTIKYGLLFRSTNMDATTADEKAIITDFLNVVVDIDLRDTTPSGSYSATDGYQYCNRPFPEPMGYINPGFRGGTVFDDLKDNEKVKAVLTSIFNTVKSGKAAIFHCYSGADRTGYFAMLIEGLLGVSEKDCTIDYELTSFGPAGYRYRTGQPTDYVFRDGIDFLRGQEGDTFQNKIENYLVETVGILQADIDEFKSLMLE